MPEVGQVGIEPTQPYGNRFTVCPASPTAALTHINLSNNFVIPLGFEPRTPTLKVLCSTY